MVKSDLNPPLQYPENKKVHPEDKGKQGDMYTIDIAYDMPDMPPFAKTMTTKPMPVIIVLGKERSEYLSRFGVIYYPIYMVKTSGKMDQIGVYEMTPAIKLRLLDKNNAVDVERLSSPPLLYNFVTREYINQHAITEDQLNELMANKGRNTGAPAQAPAPADTAIQTQTSIPIDVLEKYKTLPHSLVNTATVDITPDFPIPALIPPETRNDNMSIEKAFERSNGQHHNWLQQYMKNSNYNIINTVTDGNCFFDAITKALRTIGMNTTPDKMRAILAEHATEKDYTTYKEIYDTTRAIVDDSKKTIKQLSGEYNMIKTRLNATLDREEKLKLHNNGMKLHAEYNKAQEHHKAYVNMASEFEFMRNVKSLADFKRAIQKPSFWADAWAISQIQLLLEAKIIVIKEPSADNPAPPLSALITCDEKPDKVKDIFRPRYYIMVEYSGNNHYRLVEYKHKAVFQFSELPFKIKQAVHDSCMANTAAGFYITIPDFAVTKQALQKRADKRAQTVDNTQIMSFNMPLGKRLYDDTAPTFTVGMNVPDDIDKIDKKDPAIVAKYAPLYTQANKIMRKQLANEWMNIQKDKSPAVLFNLDNHNWASTTHYILGSKYKHNNPAFYLNFSLDSKSDISKNVAMAKAAAGKEGKYTKNPKGAAAGAVLLRPVNVAPDPEYGNNIRKITYDANKAKFDQNPVLQRVLLGTFDAKLMYYHDKKPPTPADELMKVRADLKKKP